MDRANGQEAAQNNGTGSHVGKPMKRIRKFKGVTAVSYREKGKGERESMSSLAPLV